MSFTRTKVHSSVLPREEGDPDFLHEQNLPHIYDPLLFQRMGGTVPPPCIDEPDIGEESEHCGKIALLTCALYKSNE